MAAISPEQMISVALSDAAQLGGMTLDEMKQCRWFTPSHAATLWLMLGTGLAQNRGDRFILSIDAARLARAEAEAKRPKQKELFR